jgi:ATP phosphoribosyltransferase regulatory subunit HisZ
LPRLKRLGVAETWEELRSLGTLLEKEFPGLPVRLDPTDVRHWTYYSGLTLKAFSPRHPYTVLSGGRYDGLYPSLGRPLGACGFAVHTGRLLEA